MVLLEPRGPALPCGTGMALVGRPAVPPAWLPLYAYCT